jgi:hypothetical protein
LVICQKYARNFRARRFSADRTFMVSYDRIRDSMPLLSITITELLGCDSYPEPGVSFSFRPGWLHLFFFLVHHMVHEATTASKMEPLHSIILSIFNYEKYSNVREINCGRIDTCQERLNLRAVTNSTRNKASIQTADMGTI